MLKAFQHIGQGEEGVGLRHGTERSPWLCSRGLRISCTFTCALFLRS
jgi:hypothetical protein